jgi:hypothetical protein
MDTDVPQQKSTLWIIFLLLLVIVVGSVFAVGSLNIAGTKTATKTAKPCPVFNVPAEAFRLAQIAEQYRTRNPTSRNYGLGSYAVCYASGRTSADQTAVFPGNTDPKLNPTNIMHSEQQTYRQLQNKLANPAIHTDEFVSIFVVIFSQVTVCGPCQSDMISWQSVLRQKADVEQLSLSIWQLHPGQGGFNPSIFQRGLGTPITMAGLEEVEIPFAP